MNFEQKVYPDMIYRINIAIEEMLGAIDMGSSTLELTSFSLFNSFSRKWNLCVVDKDRWEFNDEIVENVISCIEKHQDKWDNLLAQYSEYYYLSDSIDYFRAIIETPVFGKNYDQQELKDFHYHLLRLYHNYPINSLLYLDGIIYRFLLNNPDFNLHYATGNRLAIQDEKYKFIVYPWMDMTFFSNNEEVKKLNIYSSQEEGKDYIPNNIFPLSSPNNNQLNEIFTHYITPLFVGWPLRDGIKFKGKIDESTYLFNKRRIEELHKLIPMRVCFPVYDTCIAGENYGTILGIISFTLPAELREGGDISKIVTNMKRKIHILL